MKAFKLAAPALFVVAACATSKQPSRPAPMPEPPEQQQAADPQKVRQLRDDVIRGLLDKGQYYAALAHIEEQKRSGGDSPELSYLEAEARRHLGEREQAEALYRKLLGTPIEGEAYHGLGLLEADVDLEAAIRSLRRAAERLPTDVEIRNDLGYALMVAGRYAEAKRELSTAYELAPTQTPTYIKSINNLIIWMLLTDVQTGLEQLKQQADTTPETMKQLREQAQSIRSQQASRMTRPPA